MGVLDKYARRQPEGKKARTVSTKLTEEEYKEFSKYINDRGLTTAEALRWLILEEIGLGVKEKETPTLKTDVDQSRRQSTKVEESIQKYDRGRQEIAATLTASPPVAKPRKKSNQKRFTYLPWVVDGKLPCIHCKDWYQSTTFSGRHVKPHGYLDSEDYFTREREKVDAMYKERTGKDPEV